MDGGDFVDWEGIADKAVYTDGIVNVPSSKRNVFISSI